MRKAFIMRTMTGIFCIALLLGIAGCNRASQDTEVEAGTGRITGPSAPDGQVTGTVRYLDLEGGFYGIVTDDGAKLDPVNLPEELQKDGLRIRAWVEELKDRVSFHMWARLVRIRDIERL